MNTKNTLSQTAPHLFTDRQELRVAIRDAMLSNDDLRLAALRKRADQLQAQWEAQNPEKVAELEMARQDEAARCNYADRDLAALRETDPKAADMIMLLNRERARASSHALDLLTKAEIAEVKASRLENRFGLPHGQADFSKGELYQIAQRNGYAATKSGFYSALRVRELGGRTRLSCEEAEEFLSVLLPNQRLKHAL